MVIIAFLLLAVSILAYCLAIPISWAVVSIIFALWFIGFAILSLRE